MFRDSIDAFLYLLDGREGKDRLQAHRISSINIDTRYMSNGIKRCSVQVLFDDGAGYEIEACDGEADELYRAAKMWTSVDREPPRFLPEIAAPAPGLPAIEALPLKPVRQAG